MGNTNQFFLSGSTRERISAEWLAEAFHTRLEDVAFSDRLNVTGQSWLFLAAVESISMRCQFGLDLLRARCFDLSVVRHDADLPEVEVTRIDSGGTRVHEYVLEALAFLPESKAGGPAGGSEGGSRG